MKNRDSWIKQISAIAANVDFIRDVSQIKSKAILKEISVTPPDIKWNFIESQIHKNATVLSFMIENIMISEPQRIEALGQSPLRVASLWENLARLKEKTNQNKALLNAAISYEIAGYQANAACLARQISRVLTDTQKPITIEELSSMFLQRLFLKLRQKCMSVVTTKPEIHRYEDAVKSLGLSLCCQAIIYAINYFLNGEKESIAKAIDCLSDAEKLLSEGGQYEDANMTRSLRSLIPIMTSKSTWNHLGEIHENELWKRYLRLLARGLGKDIVNSPSVSELWSSQIEALNKGLLDTNSNKIIKMPTSAGKTRIAELAIVHTLISQPNAKCVYVAPYRALVSELEQSFLDLFNDLGFRVSSIVGSYEKDLFEEYIISDTDILVTTPEKLDMILRALPEFAKDVRLFIFDEGHIVNSGKRGIKFELLFTRLKRKLTNTRFLFLSAVFSNDTLNEFLEWFDPSKTQFIESTWRPSIQRFARFEWNRWGEGKMQYHKSDDNRLLETYVPKIISQHEYVFINQNTGRRNRKIFPDMKNKAHTAAELAYKFSESGPILVFSAYPKWVESVANAVATRLDLAKTTSERIPQHFESEVPKRSIMVSEEWLGQDHPVTNLLKKGIAIHHGDLPETLRKAIETDFRERKYQILVSTNTLAQGVNLPIKTVIIHSCRRYIDNEYKRISANEYWNIAGRAGRPGYETEGTIIHIVANKQDQDDYEYFLEHKDILEPTQGALFELLKDLINERIPDTEAQEMLDPEILAILAEESDEVEVSLENIINESLVGTQSRRYNIPTTRLKKVFNDTARSIKNSISDKKYWNIFNATGLSTNSCNIIQKNILENDNVVKNLLIESDGTTIQHLLDVIMNSLSGIVEMVPKRDYDGDLSELLKEWMKGKNIYKIARELDKTDTIGIANFVENYFGYLLPWGISSFLQIALTEFDLTNEELSDHVKYLSAMVKYGVPTPEASWAMMAGIPFRETAIKMAAQYASENDEIDYKEFLQWISKINHERLYVDYDLHSPVLEDVSAALTRSGVNSLLKSGLSLQDVLSEPTWIAGISHEERWINASRTRIGQELKIMRDYDNMYDRNAMKVYSDTEIGFIERNLAQFLAPYLDAGIIMKGKILKIERDRYPQIQIQLFESN